MAENRTYNDSPTFIPSRLESSVHSSIPGNGNKGPVADAKDIYDINHGKWQKDINDEIEAVPAEIERIDGELGNRYTKSETYSKTEVDTKDTTLQGNINTLDTQINGNDGIDERLSTVEELAQISIDGGTIGIATASDFDDPTPEQEAKVPTVGAIIGITDGTPTAGSDNLVKSGGVEETKLSKIHTDNLIDPSRLTDGKYIKDDGDLGNASAGYCVSDFIPVDGQDIISNAIHNETNHFRPWVAYDANKNKIPGRVGSYDNSQYTYQNGDVYVRFSFSPLEKYANYGTELIQVPYSDFAPVMVLEGKVRELEGDMAEAQVAIEQKMDGVYTDNLVDPNKVSLHSYINSSGEVKNNAASDQYVVSDYIAVDEENIVFNSIKNAALGTYVVYNSSKTKLRQSVNETATNYNYQNGDAYIRIAFIVPAGNTVQGYCKANYGNVLTNHTFEERINLEALFNSKLNKVPTVNLVDPEKCEDKKYIKADGTLGTGAAGYMVSDFIPVNSDGIISNSLSNAAGTFRAWVAYASDKTTITQVAGVGIKQYTYQEGDAFIRISFAQPNKYANYGTELVEIEYGDYAPLSELKQRVSKLEDKNPTLDPSKLVYIPNAIYSVWNNIYVERQNILKLGLSRMLGYNVYLNQDVRLKNDLRFLPIIPAAVSQVTETQFNIAEGKNTILRNTPASLSANTKPRILIIGDSVTAGYGGTCNKVDESLPVQYWAYAKMLFEMDKIDNSDSGHDALFIGGTNGDFTLNYKSVSRSVRAKAEGKGGASLDELFTSTWGGGSSVPNPFYDTVNQTFSVLTYINDYRTMDDAGVRLVSQSTDPHGESVVGSDGLTYTIGQKITSQSLLGSYDVCTPTHVFINMNHNTSETGFTNNIANVVNIVKSELPDVIFAWLVIDSTGTLFARDFPDYDPTMLAFNSLHNKNCGFFDYFKDNIEDEENGVYLLGMNFIQPEAVDHPYVEVATPIGNKETFKIDDGNITGSTWHPNNIAHANWGYELYSFIKWLISQ